MAEASAPPSAAEEAKQAGTAAFKAGRFDDAVAHFTTAIEADPQSHVLFSNRSAAYAKLEQYKASLLDANQCIKLAPTWAKGHSRRGAAYVGLRNWRQAIVAYEEGLTHEPDSAVMKEALASIQFKLSGAAAEQMQQQRGPPPGAPPVPAAAGGDLSPLTLLLTLVYFVPLLGAARRDLCYRGALWAAAATCLLSLSRSWPLGMATLKDAPLWKCDDMQRLPLLLLLSLFPPLPFILVPPAAYALHHSLSRAHARSLLTKLPAAVRERAIWVLGEEGTHTTLAFAAISDLIVGLTAPFLAASHGLRIVPPLLLHLKYVAKSHSTSWYMQTAVETVRIKLDSLFHHRRCPAPVSAAYVRCVGLAASAARLLAA